MDSLFLNKEYNMSFFSAEGAFYKFLSRFWDMVKLNFLWVIFSIPVITMGAATVAAHSVALKMIDDQEGYVARQFWKSFKENIRQGTILGIINLVCIYSLYLDFQLTDNLAFLIVGIIAAFLFFSAFVYAYPLMARYENTVLGTIKNSMRITMRYLVRTVLMLAILITEWFVFNMSKATMLIGFLIGFGVVILTISGFAMSFFRTIEKENGMKQPTAVEDIAETKEEEL